MMRAIRASATGERLLIGQFLGEAFPNETIEPLASFAADTLPSRVRALYPHEQICRPGVCEVQREGPCLSSDIVHLSDFGAGMVFANISDGNPDCLGSGGE